MRLLNGVRFLEEVAVLAPEKEKTTLTRNKNGAQLFIACRGSCYENKNKD